MQTAVFDAWAAYDKDAIGVYWPADDPNDVSERGSRSGFRRPRSEVTLTSTGMMCNDKPLSWNCRVINADSTKI